MTKSTTTNCIKSLSNLERAIEKIIRQYSHHRCLASRQMPDEYSCTTCKILEELDNV